MKSATKYLFLFFFLIISQFGNAQNVFNKAYDEGNVSNTTPNALEAFGNYYFVQRVTKNNEKHLEVVKIDSLGNVIAKNSLFSHSTLVTSYGYPGSLQVLTSKELCQLYKISTATSLNLLFFDTNLNITRTTSYAFNKTVIPAVIKQIDNNTLLTLGRIRSINNYDLFLINTDIQGNERWRTSFGEAGKDDYGYSIELINNEIIVGAQTFETSSTAHPHLFKFNIQGSLVFDTIYSSFSNGGFLAYHNNYGLFLSASVDTTGNPYSNPAIIKLNSNLGIEWSNDFFRNDTMAYLGKITLNDHGTITLAGDKFVNNEFMGLFFQTNHNGDSLNSKLLDFIPGERAQFHDIRLTSDGGYILAGDAYTPNQDSWIVKVNEWGCDSLPCTVSVAEGPKNDYGTLTCYPNPSNGLGTVNGSFKNTGSNNEIKVFNSLGQLVFSKSITNKDFEMEVNLPNRWLVFGEFVSG